MRTTRERYSKASADQRTRGLAVVGVAVAWILLATHALAEPPRVLLVTDDAALGRKVRAEAAQLGLVVVEIPGAQHGDDEASLLIRHHGVALLRVGARPARLTVAGKDGDRVTRTVSRGPEDGDAYALRIVEELHGELVELDLLPPAEEPEAQPALAEEPPPVQDPPPTEEPLSARAPAAGPEADARVGGAARTPLATPQRLWVNAGLAATSAAGGMGPALHGALGVAVEPSRHWRVAADVLLPVTPLEWETGGSAGEGSATLLLGRVSFVPWSSDVVAVDVGLGAGVATLALSGEASPPLQGRDERLFAGVFLAQGGLAWTALPWMRLRGSVFTGFSAPRPVARFDGRETAAWGRFVGGGVVTAEFGLALSGAEAGG